MSISVSIVTACFVGALFAIVDLPLPFTFDWFAHSLSRWQLT